MSKHARRPVRINRFDNITVNAHERTELWLAASFASSWSRDALVEAQRSKGDIDALGRPYTTNAGKDVHVRVKKVDQPEVAMIGSWGAHERVSVKRSGAKGINR